MLARAYAQALLKATGVLKEAEKPFENLKHVLARRGHMSLLPAIAREFKRLTGTSGGRGRGVLEVARGSDVAKLKSEIEAAAEKLNVANETLEVRENPTLIGGFLIRKGGEQVDASYRRALLNLYTRLKS